MIGRMRNAYHISIGETRGNRTLWRPRRKWNSNTEIDIKRIDCVDMKWRAIMCDYFLFKIELIRSNNWCKGKKK
jgi:hypothetical protein